MLERLNITKVSLDDKRSARVWGRCQLKRSKAPVQSTGLYIRRCQRKLISRRQITETCVALPHKDLRKASCSLQGDAQLTLAYDIMHGSAEKTISSYDELVCLENLKYNNGTPLLQHERK